MIVYPLLATGNLLLFLSFTASAEISPISSGNWFQNRDNCTVRSSERCKPIESSLQQSCLGTPLPYRLTSDVPIIDDVPNFDLQLWTTLMAVPTCWDKLQIFLCTVYVPECQPVEKGGGDDDATDNRTDNGAVLSRVVLPERGMCQAVRKACPHLFSDGEASIRLLEDTIPRFLQCENYAATCRHNKLRPKIFDANRAQCLAPLVTTSNSRHWIKGIPTCAFPCRSPVFRPAHYTLSRGLTFGAAIVGIIVNTFVLLTLGLLRSPSSESCRCLPLTKSATGKLASHRHRQNSLAHTSLTFIHFAFLIGCFGWLIPHLPIVGDAVACRADGSVRSGEPQTQTGSPFLCVASFMLVYVPLFAAALWSNVLDYAIFAAFNATAARLRLGAGAPHRSRRRCISPSIPTAPNSSPDAVHQLGLGRLFARCWSRRKRRLLLHRQQQQQRHQLVQRGIVDTSANRGSLLIPPDSCELSKKRVGGDNQCMLEEMRRSVTPVSPQVGVPRGAAGGDGDAIVPPPYGNHQWSSPSPGVSSLDQSLPLTYRMLFFGPICGFDDDVTNHVGGATRDSTLPRLADQQRRPTADFNSVGSQTTCTHIAACVIPAVFALICLTASEVDGEPLSGLCLVGLRNLWAYCVLLVAPLSLCLLIKIVYLARAMYSMTRLRRYLARLSFHPMDREMGHRLIMCCRAYVVYILTLATFLSLSVAIHMYVYTQEPNWIEPQRLFLFCQMRHRFMGLDAAEAFAACQNAGSSSFHVEIPPPPLSDTTNFTSLQFRGRRSEAAAATMTIRFPDNHLHHHNPTGPIPQQALAGPIMLNLLTYFFVNLVFASMCLLDRAVKRRWIGLCRRIVAFLALPCRREAKAPPCPTAANSIETAVRLPPSFSWWDPGFIFLLDNHHLHPPSPAAEADGSVEKAEAERAATTVTMTTAAVAAAQTAIRGTKGGPPVMMRAAATAAASDVSCNCSRRYSSSTNDESCLMPSSSTTGGVGGGGGGTSIAIRVGGGCASSSVVSCATTSATNAPLPPCPLHHHHHQHQQQQQQQHLVSVNSSQSLFITGAGRSMSSACGTLFNPFAQPPLSTTARRQDIDEDSLAALAAATALHQTVTRKSSRRGRHRWSGKTSGRRRLGSRYYSTIDVAGIASATAAVATATDTATSHGSLQLHRAPSSSVAPIKRDVSRDLSIASLSRLYAAAAAMELQKGSSKGSFSRSSMRSFSHRRLSHRQSLGSSAAESYNSFQLLNEQAGATWREVWRTRMLVMDALHWAQSTAAQQEYHQQQSADQQQLINMMAYFMAGGVGEQNSQPPATPLSGGAVGDGNMMAALVAAATAAAQAAIARQQQSTTKPLDQASCHPMSSVSTGSSARFPGPISTSASRYFIASPLEPSSLATSKPDLLVNHNLHQRSRHHDAVCHLDAASANVAMAPSPRSGWNSLFPCGCSPASQFSAPPPHSMGYGYLPVLPSAVAPVAAVHLPIPLDTKAPALPVEKIRRRRRKNSTDDDDGSDEFNSEDEVRSSSDKEAVEDDEDDWTSFPTPEGQPAVIVEVGPGRCLKGVHRDSGETGGGQSGPEDDASSVSQSASQVVVAVSPCRHDQSKKEADGDVG